VALFAQGIAFGGQKEDLLVAVIEVAGIAL